MRAKLALLCTVFLFVGACAALGQDACSDVLAIGLTDVYNREYSNDLASSLYDWACSEKAKSYWSSHSDGFSLSSDDFSIGSASDDSRRSSFSAKDCKEFESAITSRTYERVAAKLLSPIARDAIGAWRDCVGVNRHSPNGIIARVKHYSAKDGLFEIELTWRNQYSGQKAPVIQEYSVTNADCDNCERELSRSIRTAFTRPSVHDTVLKLTRKLKDQRVFFSLQTDQGPLHPTIVIPLHTDPPSGQCSPDCSDCAVEHGHYVCKECTVRVSSRAQGTSDAHLDLPLGQRGMFLTCYPLTPSAKFRIIASGPGSAEFTNRYGNHAGDSNGNVDWWIGLALNYKLGDGIEHQAGYLSRANIRERNISITIEGQDTVSQYGMVESYLYLATMQMWPVDFGPLTLGKDFQIRIKLQ